MAPVHGNINAAPVAPPPDLKVFRPQNGDACRPSDKSMHP
jgi:hypothetical protein